MLLQMKITITRQDIVGPIKLPGFNGVGEINLEDFIGMEIEIPKGYEFESLGSLDLLTEVDELDDKWSNDGVREEGNTEERIQALENNFSIKGYLTKYTPGMGSKEGPVEGRGRALGAKRNGEKKIPWINLKKTVAGERPRISGGVLKNFTLIIDGIIKRYAEGENAVRIKERKPWMEILNKEFHIPVDNKTTFLFSMDAPTYSCRCFCDAVLEYGTKTPVDIILYTKRRLPSEAREKKDIFLKDLAKYTRLTYKAIGNKRGMKFEDVDLKQHYTIKGCIPQFIEDHKDEWNSKELVDISDY